MAKQGDVTTLRHLFTPSRERGDLGGDVTSITRCDLRRDEEALGVLDEIRVMVSRRQRIVVGDETLFLERLRARTQDVDSIAIIRELAKTLSPVCRDKEFKARLQSLTEA